MQVSELQFYLLEKGKSIGRSVVQPPPRAESSACTAVSEGECQHVGDGNPGDRSTDAALLIRAQRGDHAAFTRLVERYRPYVIRYCRGYLKDHHRAEDATQVAFTRAWINIGDCRGEFRPWLLAIAKNYGLDELKKPESRRLVWFAQEHELAGVACARETLDEVVTRRLDLIAAIESLPPPYRAVVELHIAGEQFVTLAPRLGIRPATARKRFERAVKILRILLMLDEGECSNETVKQS
jgi:RNA polymerase sigma-70 factor (ECF subfamily)